MDKIKKLPCPYCGKTETEEYRPNNYYLFHWRCVNCGWSTPVNCPHFETGEKTGDAETELEYWNKGVKMGELYKKETTQIYKDALKAYNL